MIQGNVKGMHGFVMDMLFDYLKPCEGIFISTIQSGDLFNLMGTCRSMKDTLRPKIIKITYFKSSMIHRLGSNITFLRYLDDDNDMILDGINTLLNVTSLQLSPYFNDPLRFYVLPQNLKILVLGHNFDQKL